MSVLPVLMIAGLALALVFLGAFIWAVRSGQFDDTTTPAMRIIGDDTQDHRNEETEKQREP